MSMGLLLIMAALILTIYNLWDENRARENVAFVIEQIEDTDTVADAEEKKNEKPEYEIYPDMEMPTIEIDGHYYIGTLEIPVYGLKLPVMEEWSYPKLKISPCRYYGSAYRDDMIIAAHNFSSHFGQIKNLIAGDEVIFTDVDGNRFIYQVMNIEILGKYDGVKLEEGDWDLTLFTCTYGGRTRVTIRCAKK